MKKRIDILVLLTLVSSFVFAENYKLVKHYQIGPGTYYSEYTHPEPWVLYVVEIDATNPYIQFESVKANDYMFAFEGPSSMSKRNNEAGHEVLSAINGDYYNTSTGEPISTHVVNGEFVRLVKNTRTNISINKFNKPTIVTTAFSGAILTKDSTDHWRSYALSNINKPRLADQMIMFNDFWRSTTGSNENGNECMAEPIDEWLVNDTIRCIVRSKELNTGNLAIPNDKIVLSGDGEAATFIADHIDIGDTVKVVQRLVNNLPALTQVVGGGPQMLKDGIDVVNINYPIEKLGLTHCSYRHPRTAMGFNEDSARIYFVVVDGRQHGFSVGMSLYELADFMKQIGVQHAINLDGGGSSSITVRNSIMNSPSDGSERRVANGMLCVSSAPAGDLTHVQFIQDSLAVYKNLSINTNLTGWDENYNPVGLGSWDSINLTYDTNLGSFNENVFTANEQDGDTYLTADYNGDKDSVIIHVIELYALSIYPEIVTIDSLNGVEFQVTATNEAGGTRAYDNEIFEFSILDPNIASIDENGNVIGKITGETKVVVQYGDQTDTADVIVAIGEGEVVVDEIESTDDWIISGDSYINMTETELVLADRITATGTKAFQINYSRTGDEDGNIYLETTPIDVYGVPSDILIDVLSDSIKHWIYVVLEDARGVEYSVKSSSSLRYNDAYRTQYLDMGNMLPADGEQLYPMKLTGIRLRIDDAATTGSMYVDRIRVIYPTWTTIGDDTNEMLPGEYYLHQNYPNPFNPLTKISYEIAKAGQVNLSVYDITGNRVATLVHGYQNAGMYNVEFLADKLSTGVYFYRIEAGDWIDTKKMLIIK